MSSKKNNKQSKESVTELTLDKIKEQIVLSKKELFNLRFQKALGELKNTSRFSQVRKEIARLNTELNARSSVGGK